MASLEQHLSITTHVQGVRLNHAIFASGEVILSRWEVQDGQTCPCKDSHSAAIMLTTPCRVSGNHPALTLCATIRRVEHWRAQPKVGSFRSPLFRWRSGCLVRPSPTFPAAPPQIPYGGCSPVRLQAQAPRSSVWNLPPYRSALTSDP